MSNIKSIYKRIFGVLLLAVLLFTSVFSFDSFYVKGEEKQEEKKESYLYKTLYEEDFDDGKADDFLYTQGKCWSVVDGKLRFYTDSPSTVTTGSAAYAPETLPNYENVRISADITTYKTNNTNAGQRYSTGGIRYYTSGSTAASQNKDAYEWRIRILDSGYKSTVYKYIDGTKSIVGGKAVDFKIENFNKDLADTLTYHAEMEHIGNRLVGKIDGTVVFDLVLTDETLTTMKGSFGFYALTEKKSVDNFIKVDFDNVKVDKATDIYDTSLWEKQKFSDDKFAVKDPWTIDTENKQLVFQYSVTTDYAFSYAYVPDSIFNYKNGRIKAKVTSPASGTEYAKTSLLIHSTTSSVTKNAYEFRVIPSSTGYTAQIFNLADNASSAVASVKVAGKNADYDKGSISYILECEYVNGKIRGYIDGTKVIEYDTANDKTALTEGSFGLRVLRVTKGSSYGNIVFSDIEFLEPYPEAEPEEEEEEKPTKENDSEIAHVKGTDKTVIIVYDTFSGDALSTGWNSAGYDTNAGEWSLSNGAMLQATDSSSQLALYDKKSYNANYVSVDTKIISEETGNIYSGIVFAFTDTKNYYMVRLGDIKDGETPAADVIQIYRVDKGKASKLASADLTSKLERNKYYRLSASFENGIIKGYLNGTELVTYDTKDDTVKYTEGSCGVRSSQGKALFDNFAIGTLKEEATYTEDFNSMDTFEGTTWTWNGTDKGKAGNWTITDGVVYQNDGSSSGTTILINDSGVYNEFVGVSGDFMLTSDNTVNTYAGPVAAYNGGCNCYALRIGRMKDGTSKIQLYKFVNGSAELLLGVNLEFDLKKDTWYNVEMYQYNGNIYGYIDKTLYLTYESTAELDFKAGYFGVRVSQSTAKFDNLVVYGKAMAIEEDESVNIVVENPDVFTDDFEEETAGEDPDYWLEKNKVDNWKVSDIQGNKVYEITKSDVTSSTWLHVFETNIDYSVKMYVPETLSETSDFGLITRLTGTEAMVLIGYNAKESKWYVSDQKGIDFKEKVTFAENTTQLIKGGFNTLRVEEIGKTLKFWCNDVLVIETKVDQVTTGRVGFFTKNTAIKVDDITLKLLSGQGRVEKAAITNYILDCDETSGHARPFRLDDNTLMIQYRSRVFLSYDDGITFTEVTGEAKNAYSGFLGYRGTYLRLHDGKIMVMDGSACYMVRISSDNGKTFTSCTDIISAAEVQNRGTQGLAYYGGDCESLSEWQLADGTWRIFAVMHTRTDGLRTGGSGSAIYHWEEIYYSDDQGLTWNFAGDTRALSCAKNICESQIIQCADGTLRLYSTWNSFNSIRYYESYDGGLTWEGEYALPDIRCAKASFSVMQDPNTPYTYYAVWAYSDPNVLDDPQPRTRLGLMKSEDGKNWEYLMDCWRWEDVKDDNATLINQIVDPVVYVDDDYILVTSGWSECKNSGYHNKLAAHILKLNKADLEPYECFPEAYADKKEVLHIEVVSPAKTVYNKGEVLDLTGGKVKVFYYDGTVEEIDLSDSHITIAEPDLSQTQTTLMGAPDMNETGVKNLRVTFGNISDTFTVVVAEDETQLNSLTKDTLKLCIDNVEITDKAEITVYSSKFDISGNVLSLLGGVKVEINSAEQQIASVDTSIDGTRYYFEKTMNLSEGENTLTIKVTDATGSVISYSFKVKFIKNEWTIGESSGMEFVSKADIRTFKEVMIDGKTVDSENYTVKSGSTKVELSKQYLDKLSPGEHTLTIVSITGNADFDFSVDTPPTGEHNGLICYIIALILSLLEIIVMLKSLKVF